MILISSDTRSDLIRFQNLVLKNSAVEVTARVVDAMTKHVPKDSWLKMSNWGSGGSRYVLPSPELCDYMTTVSYHTAIFDCFRSTLGGLELCKNIVYAYYIFTSM